MGNLIIIGSEDTKILLDGDNEIIQDISFSRATITGKIKYKKFINCSFSYCDFQKCDLSTCLFEKCSIYNAIFNFTILPERSITDCDFTEIKMRNSFIRYLVFTDCNFNNIDIARCDLGYAGFTRCRFNSSCFFAQSCLDATLFEFCCFDKDCRFINNCFMQPKFNFCDFPKNRIFINNMGHFYVDRATEYHSPVIDMICPEEGSFIAYKKIKIDWGDYKQAVVTLEIPEEARRVSGDGDKCRCDIARVKKIEAIDNELNGELVEVPADMIGHSFFDCTFKYQKDKWVKADNFCDDPYKECAPGIHFFISKKKAIAY